MYINLKLAVLLAVLVLIGLPNKKLSPTDYGPELDYIAQAFKIGIMNVDECRRQKQAAHDLVNEIDAAMTKGDYSSGEVLKLHQFKKEAEAIEKYIDRIGNCNNNAISLSDFYLANNRINAIVVSKIRDKYCADVISVNIGDYVVYLAENNSSQNYTVAYKWKVLNGLDKGNGTMGMLKMSVRPIYDNREHQRQKNITVYGITCQEF